MFEDSCPGLFSVEHFCEIFDNSFMGCAVIERELLQPIGVNQALCAILGLSPHEILSKNLLTDDPEVGDARGYLLEVVFPNARKYGHSAPVELRHDAVTGEVLYLKVQCFMIKSVILETDMYVLLVVDITPRKNWKQNDGSANNEVGSVLDMDIIAKSRLQRRLAELNLTRTEIAVCLHLRKSKSTKDIANDLGISVATVNTHRRNVRAKLGLKGERQSLYRWLIQS